jgi:hypothetical protein
VKWTWKKVVAGVILAPIIVLISPALLIAGMIAAVIWAEEQF